MKNSSSYSLPSIRLVDSNVVWVTNTKSSFSPISLVSLIQRHYKWWLVRHCSSHDSLWGIKSLDYEWAGGLVQIKCDCSTERRFLWKQLEKRLWKHLSDLSMIQLFSDCIYVCVYFFFLCFLITLLDYEWARGPFQLFNWKTLLSMAQLFSDCMIFFFAC